MGNECRHPNGNEIEQGVLYMTKKAKRKCFPGFKEKIYFGSICCKSIINDLFFLGVCAKKTH